MAKEQNQAKALAALLDSNTLTEAAEKAGISRRTLYGYIRDDADFCKAYKAAQERMAIEQMEATSAGVKKAQDVIISIMNDPGQPGAVRLRAAQAIINSAEKQAVYTRLIMTSNMKRNNPSNILNKWG